MNVPVREDSLTVQETYPALGEQVLARRPGANVNQFLQLWVTGLWLDVTHSVMSI